MKVDLSCPLELWEYHLPTKPGEECSLLMFNLEKRVLSSLQVHITIHDKDGTELASRTERPMALKADGKQSFEVKFPIEDCDKMESLSLLFEKVWFEDGTVWRRAPSVQLIEYAANDLPSGRALENLRYVAGPDAVGYPENQGKVWLCVCGRVNSDDENTCRRCGRSREYVFINDSKDAVSDAIAARERELEQKGRIAREDASRTELIRQAAMKRRDVSYKHRWVGAACAAAVIVALYFIIVLGAPEWKYYQASRALAQGRPLTARAMYEELLDYKDAPEKLLACDYENALLLVDKGDMESLDEALAAFARLDGYEDSKTRMNEASYAQASLLLDFGEYERASAAFFGLGAYKDAPTKYRFAEYKLATRLMNSAQYELAATRFSKLGDYEDAKELAQRCLYRPAAAAMAEARYDDAAALFKQIPDYQDSAVQLSESLYLSGMQYKLDGDPMAARERFVQAGTYRDSVDQMKETTYDAALALRDTGDYAGAVALFYQVEEYKDSAEQISGCTYEPAKALMASGQYEKAATLLEAVPNYKDSADLLMQCSYLPASDLFSQGEWAEAAALFEKIINYKDSADKLNNCRYNMAQAVQYTGDLAQAADIFDALGDYKDSKEQASSIRYAIATNLFDSDQFDLAARQFGALGTYKDSEAMVLECAYEAAADMKENGNLEGARDAFLAIEGLPKAKEAASACVYEMAKIARGMGDLTRAAELFLEAGNYQDAKRQHDQCIYDEAIKWMDALDYQRAGELFDSVAEFEDAKAKSAQCYDLWLKDRLDQAKALLSEKKLAEIIELLKELPMDDIPDSYAEMRSIYYAVNLTLGQRLVDADKLLEAWAYLKQAGNSEEAKKLREKRIYKLLGEWQTSSGARYAFYEDYSCVIAGETGYYFTVENYGVYVGEAIGDRTITYRLLTYDDKDISMKDQNDKTIRLTRVADPEV